LSATLAFAFVGAATLGNPSAATAVTGATVTGSVELARPRGSAKTDNSNAVVWLTPLTPGSGGVALAAARRFAIVQEHKRFEPHVLVVPVGSRVDFPNRDPFFHNVFSLFNGKRFDLGLYEAGATHGVTFDRPGVCYIFCNIHPEMSAVVLVMDRPYYGVSNRAGRFSIPNVPPGRYKVQVWHEHTAPDINAISPHELVVADSDQDLGVIHLVESAGLAAPHKNKYGRDYDAANSPVPLYLP
jgi:plastocyanin